MKSAARLILTFVVVCTAAAVGIYVGTAGRGMSADHRVEPTEYMPNLKLPVGAQFPEITLQNRYEQFLSTRDALGSHGAVVLFMEIGCPPCRTMAAKWQNLINRGVIDSTQVFGVTYNTPDYLDVIQEKDSLTFPVYSDTAGVFLHSFGVDAFPLAVVVRPTGEIAYINGDANRSIDVDKLGDWLGH